MHVHHANFIIQNRLYYELDNEGWISADNRGKFILSQPQAASGHDAWSTHVHTFEVGALQGKGYRGESFTL